MPTSLDKPFNYLNSNGFIFNIQRLPETMFRVVGINMPGVTVPEVQGGYPGSTQYYPGSFTEYETLSVTFLVDENLVNYGEVYKWVTQQRFAIKDYIPSNDSEKLLVSDGFLTTLNNSSNPGRVIYFKDMFPVAISGWNMATNSDVRSVECTVTFRYSHFELR